MRVGSHMHYDVQRRRELKGFPFQADELSEASRFADQLSTREESGLSSTWTMTACISRQTMSWRLSVFWWVTRCIIQAARDLERILRSVLKPLRRLSRRAACRDPVSKPLAESMHTFRQDLAG